MEKGDVLWCYMDIMGVYMNEINKSVPGNWKSDLWGRKARLIVMLLLDDVTSIWVINVRVQLHRRVGVGGGGAVGSHSDVGGFVVQALGSRSGDANLNGWLNFLPDPTYQSTCQHEHQQHNSSHYNANNGPCTQVTGFLVVGVIVVCTCSILLSIFMCGIEGRTLAIHITTAIDTAETITTGVIIKAHLYIYCKYF